MEKKRKCGYNDILEVKKSSQSISTQLSCNVQEDKTKIDENEVNSKTYSRKKSKFENNFLENDKCKSKEEIEEKILHLSEVQPSLSEKILNETSYYFKDGFRFVKPYYFTFHSFTKGRWLNKPLIQILTTEFTVHGKEYYV